MEDEEESDEVKVEEELEEGRKMKKCRENRIKGGSRGTQKPQIIEENIKEREVRS